MGNNKKRNGVIVIREGDNIQGLAKNFVNLHGLKKDSISKVVKSLN